MVLSGYICFSSMPRRSMPRLAAVGSPQPDSPFISAFQGRSRSLFGGWEPAADGNAASYRDQAREINGKRKEANQAANDKLSAALAALRGEETNVRGVGRDAAHDADRIVLAPLPQRPSWSPQLHRQHSDGAMAAKTLELLLRAAPYDTLQAAFDRFDLDGDGELSASEVDAALSQLGVHFTPEQVEAFIRIGNTHEERAGAGTLSEDEFFAMVRRHRRLKLRASIDDPSQLMSPAAKAAASKEASNEGAAARRHLMPAVPPRPRPMDSMLPLVPATYLESSSSGDGRRREAVGGGSAAGGVDLEARLGGVIGLEPIKEKVRGLKDMLIKRRFRKEVGAPLVDTGPLHMLFVGNPGCGKTSIARLLAKLLYDLGAVRSRSFVEVQRTDLVASHIGQTGPKTRAKIEEARGGVLFVDEAYRLTSASDKDFGTEALEEVHKAESRLMLLWLHFSLRAPLYALLLTRCSHTRSSLRTALVVLLFTRSSLRTALDALLAHTLLARCSHTRCSHTMLFMRCSHTLLAHAARTRCRNPSLPVPLKVLLPASQQPPHLHRS